MVWHGMHLTSFVEKVVVRREGLVHRPAFDTTKAWEVAAQSARAHT